MNSTVQWNGVRVIYMLGVQAVFIITDRNIAI